MSEQGLKDRGYWVDVVRRVAGPVLRAAAEGRLRRDLSTTGPADNEARKTYEAVGRTLAGIAPFLAGEGGDAAEASHRGSLIELARRSVANVADPASADYVFGDGVVLPHVVDAAYLAHAVLRAPAVLWEPLAESERDRLVAILVQTRVQKPVFNNWLLFSGIVEATLRTLGRGWDPMRVDYALRQHDQWYLGDGHYGDGPAYHADYYNSFVIHPMLLDTAEACRDHDPAWAKIAERARVRMLRYAAVQERLISPEGTLPPIGRSLAYRFGALHALGQVALRGELPEPLTPAAVRSAMTAVVRRQVEATGTFDDGGFLRVGVCGHQPSLGEVYISPASCYLCLCGLLPLGLPPNNPFWSDPAEPWTAQRVYGGEDVTRDVALCEG